MSCGEFAALALFSGSIDRDSATGRPQRRFGAGRCPTIDQPAADARRTRRARPGRRRGPSHRDEALIVARCEYHPTPACPQTRITGVPGSGPETRTANELLADSQRELDNAVAARDRRVPELDAQINHGERALDEARQSAIRGAGSRFGLALGRHAAVDVGQRRRTDAAPAHGRVLRSLGLLPLILRRWRGETTHDRHAQARAERERAELVADTAIAVKRAEVRAAAETMWAEQQLAQARLAVEAQTEIDRAQLRRRVNAELKGRRRGRTGRRRSRAPHPSPSRWTKTSTCRSPPRRTPRASPPPHCPSRGGNCATESDNLPALVEPRDTPATQSIPTIPDVTRAAARWIRPLVPALSPARSTRQLIRCAPRAR